MNIIKSIYNFFRDGFNLDYPLGMSFNENGYYIDFTKVSDPRNLREPFHIIDFDKKGIPVCDYTSVGRHYNYTFVSLWALTQLELYNKTKDEKYLKNFSVQVNFLEKNVRYRGKAAVWENDFSWTEGRAVLKPPFPDAMTQGLVISVLTRAHKFRKDRKYIKLVKDAVNIFNVPIEKGGIKADFNGKDIYEEYPAYPLSLIMDGFVFGLIGLYDAWKMTKDKKAVKLFKKGVDCLHSNLEYWNYRNNWSWFGSHGYLSSRYYHKLNRLQLMIMYNITKKRIFLERSIAWNPNNFNIFKKIRIISSIIFYSFVPRRTGL